MSRFLAALALALCLTARAGDWRQLEYGREDGEPLLLDVQGPNAGGPHPMVIAVHGGGWASGSKEDMRFILEPLVESNFVCFSLGYRLAPTNRWPACFDDVCAGIVWIKNHAAEFSGDSNRVALIGYSAGGHLVCQAATQGLGRARVQAVVGCAAPTDLVADSARRPSLSKSMVLLLDRTNFDNYTRAMLWEMSPINHAAAGQPPFLLIQGDADKTVPLSQSVNFRAALLSHDVPCDLITIPGAQHRIADWKKFDPAWQQKIAEWLQQKLAR